MPKTEPTHDDLVSALYEIREIANGVVLGCDLECAEEPPSITRILEICDKILPD